MLPDTTKQEIVSRLSDIEDVFDLLVALEKKFPIRISAVTKQDVNSEFRFILEGNGDEPRDMTDQEWGTFRSEWFWREGAHEVMWEGIAETIRWDLLHSDIVSIKEGAK